MTEISSEREYYILPQEIVLKMHDGREFNTAISGGRLTLTENSIYKQNLGYVVDTKYEMDLHTEFDDFKIIQLKEMVSDE